MVAADRKEAQPTAKPTGSQRGAYVIAGHAGGAAFVGYPLLSFSLSLSLSSVFFPLSDSLPILSLSLSIPPSLPISVLDLPILPLRSSRACLSRSFYLAGVAPRVFPSIRSVSRIFPSRFPSPTCGRLIALFTPCSLRSPGCVRPGRKFRRATTSAESGFVRANCGGPPRRASQRIRRSNTAHRSCKTRDRRHLAQMHTPTEGGASPGALSFSLSRLRLSCWPLSPPERPESREADATRDAASPRSIFLLVLASLSLSFSLSLSLSLASGQEGSSGLSSR